MLREGLAIVTLGVVSGLACAALAGRGIRALLFEVARGDPRTFLCVSALIVLAALTACRRPARRAISLAPIAALRVE